MNDILCEFNNLIIYILPFSERFQKMKFCNFFSNNHMIFLKLHFNDTNVKKSSLLRGSYTTVGWRGGSAFKDISYSCGGP